MKPITFPEQNMVLGKPASLTDEQCGAMGVCAGENSMGPVCVSCWKMGFWERIKVLFTGKVWVHVLAHRSNQPPISIDVHYPFTGK